jgi:hypothetical protein
MQNIVNNVWICIIAYLQLLATLFLFFAILMIKILELVEVVETVISFEKVNAYILQWVLMLTVLTMMHQLTALPAIRATICSTIYAQESILTV